MSNINDLLQTLQEYLLDPVRMSQMTADERSEMWTAFEVMLLQASPEHLDDNFLKTREVLEELNDHSALKLLIATASDLEN